MTGPHVAVVGGGIAGLAAAHELVHGDAKLRVTLLEASPRLGGVIQTERRDGYLLEAGPDLFLAAKPGAWELAGALGLRDRLHGPREGVGGSFLLSRGRLARLPEGLTGLVPTRMMPFVKTGLISPLGKLRVAMDFVIPPRLDDADESVESFVVRRLGRAMYDRIVEPLLSGIFAGDGSKLSVLATFPHLRAAEREHGSLGRSMLAAKRREREARAKANGEPASGDGPRRAGFVTFRGGQSEMVEALERVLTAAPLRDRVSLRTRAAVRAIDEREGGYRVTLTTGEAIEADAVVLAAPAWAAAEAIAELDPQAAAAMRRIPYISTANVNIAFRRADVPHRLEGSGWTTPRVERRPVLACTWSSSKFEGRAPADVALFRAFVGDATNQSVVSQTDDEIVKTVRAELAQVLGVTAEPVLVRLNRYERVMPQYNLGHLERVAAIDERLAAHPGLVVAGSAYRGVGVPDVISSGMRAAAAIRAHLASRRDSAVA